MEELETKIELLRQSMYKAYNENKKEVALQLSTELDQLLNKLSNTLK